MILITRGSGSVVPTAYLAARGMSWLGAAATLVAVPVLVYAQTRSPLAAALATALEALPYLLLGLRAGAVADRTNPGRLLEVTARRAAAALVATALAVAVLPPSAGVAVLLCGTVVVTALATYGDAAGFALLPRLVRRDQLAAANGQLSALGLLLQAVGVGLAAVLLAVGAGEAVLLLHAALLVGTARAASKLAEPSRDGSQSQPATSSGPGDAGGVREGLRFIRHHPVVGPLTAGVALHSLTTGAVGGLLAVFADEALGWGDRPALTALLYLSLMSGGLIASAATPRLLPRTSPSAFVVPCAALSLLPLGLLTVGGASGALAVVLVVAWQALASMVVLGGITMRQIVTPLPLQGRVGVTGRMIAWGTAPLGAVLGGVLATSSGVRPALLALGAGTLGCVLLLSWSAARFTELRRPVASHVEAVLG